MAGNNSIQFLRGTQSKIDASTQIALAGQPVFATDTNRLYVGDGSKQIKELEYLSTRVVNNSKVIYSGDIFSQSLELDSSSTPMWKEANGQIIIQFYTYLPEDSLTEGNTPGRFLFTTYNQDPPAEVKNSIIYARVQLGLEENRDGVVEISRFAITLNVAPIQSSVRYGHFSYRLKFEERTRFSFTTSNHTYLYLRFPAGTELIFTDQDSFGGLTYTGDVSDLNFSLDNPGTSQYIENEGNFPGTGDNSIDTFTSCEFALGGRITLSVNNWYLDV